MKSDPYPLPELIKRWEREQITIEQTIGQLLLLLGHLSKRVAQLEAAQRRGHPSSQ
ncbi:MAG: hypothetical protein AAF485_29900 [Chloroflexota bacterium]